MGNAFIIRSNGINKQYVDSQDSKKVDKQEGKMLSSNDFTNYYKEKLDSALQGIQCNGQNVNSYQNIVNLTPAILGALVDKSIMVTEQAFYGLMPKEYQTPLSGIFML